MDHTRSREANERIGCLTQAPVKADREALGRVFATHRPLLFRQALRILDNREDAEDALQDAFLSATRYLSAFQGRSALSTWVTRIVINAALMVRRSRPGYRTASLEEFCSGDEGEVPFEIADIRPDPEHLYSLFEFRALLQKRLEQLPPGLRSAFRLHFVDGLRCGDVGQSLGITLSASKSRASRARRRLADGLKDSYGGDRETVGELPLLLK